MLQKRMWIACAAGLAGMLSGAQAAAPLLVSETFEGGVLRTGSLYVVSGNSPALTSERARSGRYAMKSVLNRKTSANSYRTEISIPSPKVEMGDERWYGFSIFLPSGYKASPVWESVVQWHDTPNDWDHNRGFPPLHLATSRGGKFDRWTVANLWDAQPVAANGSYTLDGNVVWDLGAWETNKWTDWVFRVRWSYGNDGLLQVWKDGKLVINRTGPNTYNDKIGPYFKAGIYKGWKDRSNPVDTISERIVYHDEIRIAGPGASYSDVAPGGAAAAPTVVPRSPTEVTAE